MLEALILTGALGMTEDDISHLNGLDYARTPEVARAKVDAGEADAAFLMSPTPVDRVRDVAAAGENMPPKSTYFYPKVLTGMVFNPLEDEMALINRSANAVSGAMRAVARKRERYTHDVKAGGTRSPPTSRRPRAARTWARARRSCSPRRWPPARR